MAHRSLCLDSEEEHGSRKKTGQVGSRRWALEVTNEAPSKPQGGGEILYMSPLLLATSPCMWVLERSHLLSGLACSPLPISLAVSHWFSLVLCSLNPRKSPHTPLPLMAGSYCSPISQKRQLRLRSITSLAQGHQRINSRATWSLNPR